MLENQLTKGNNGLIKTKYLTFGMEAANLIYRDRGDKDRRKILIFLTEEAKGLEQEYNEVTEEISNIYYKGFSEEEIEQLENYLHRILKNVEGVL